MECMQLQNLDVKSDQQLDYLSKATSIVQSHSEID